MSPSFMFGLGPRLPSVPRPLAAKRESRRRFEMGARTEL